MNTIDIIVICIIAVLAAAALIAVLIRRHKGKTCSCGCENCVYACHKRKSGNPHM